ncbi:DNA polymerase I [Microbaculum marinum]|uniref:DNA polymerase I n=1 Tax=Microbaculum marinum TaxID=1764581 RepID=A0AAW9RQA3_9HYPH
MPSSSISGASRPIQSGDHLYLVDGSSYIFRAYHALPPLTRKSDGLPIGAVHGFCQMLWKLVREADGEGDGAGPTHLAVIFDYSARSFRNDLYDQYKAHRPEPPEDLRPQFGLIRQAVAAFNIACVEQEGYEADDLIATYAREAAGKGATVTIVASDKDLMQLVGDGIEMLDPMKEKRIGVAEVEEKFGVRPDRVVDVQALAGDSVDNIPGVPGIGVKTAAQLITEYGDLEALLQRADEIKQPKRRQNLLDHAQNARISRQLAELKCDVPVEVAADELGVRDPDPERLIAFCKAMEFTTITRRVADATGFDPAKVEPGEVTVKYWPPEGATATPVSPAAPAAAPAATLATDAEPAAPEVRSNGAHGPGTPAAAAAAAAAALEGVSVDRSAYETVDTIERLDAWIAEAYEAGVFSIDTETTSLFPMQAELVGLSIATAPGKACYVPLAHRNSDGLDLAGEPPRQIPLADGLQRLKPLLEDRGTLKIAQNMKYDWLVFLRYGIDVRPFDDTMLLSYALDAGLGGNGMDELSERWFGHKPIKFAEVAGSGRNKVTFDLVPLDKATEYAAEDADVTLRLWRVLKPRLAADHSATVYETLERPMVTVLAGMERRGIMVDRAMLSRLSGDFAQSAAALEAEIYELAGETFNVGSPKQLGDILFGKMGLPGAKKTKTGAWTTGASVLEDLAAAGHELPSKVLAWRQLTKLKSTYTDALPGYVNAETGRVHTCYALAATTTGRLSSSEPNLQNIPVRTEEGRRIRKAFIAEKGMKLVSADYSQIELRVLAHIADIPQLRKAFEDGLDIHAMTASEMFGVPVEGMDPMVRRRAKAINFGIIYGISAFGLANQLAIPRQEAADYIKRYFERFPGIRDYMDSTKAFARANGYVETIFGRRCNYPNITRGHPSERAFFERAAINAPIQGSAADIIRRAMVRMEDALEKAGVEASMLLQVHDELIFEVPEDAVNDVMPVIARVMEEAPLPAVELKVPLRVDARAADNWDEAH